MAQKRENWFLSCILLVLYIVYLFSKVSSPCDFGLSPHFIWSDFIQKERTYVSLKIWIKGFILKFYLPYNEKMTPKAHSLDTLNIMLLDNRKQSSISMNIILRFNISWWRFLWNKDHVNIKRFTVQIYSSKYWNYVFDQFIFCLFQIY